MVALNLDFLIGFIDHPAFHALFCAKSEAGPRGGGWRLLCFLELLPHVGHKVRDWDLLPPHRQERLYRRNNTLLINDDAYV